MISWSLQRKFNDKKKENQKLNFLSNSGSFFYFWASQWPGQTFKVEKSNKKLILENRHFWKMLGTQRINSGHWSYFLMPKYKYTHCKDSKLQQKEPIIWYVLCRSFAIKNFIWTCYCTVMFVTSWKGFTSIFWKLLQSQPS